MASVQYHVGKFPPAELDWPRLIPLIGPASAAIARFDGVLAAIVNPQVLLTPLTTQEAVLSSRIEGTQTTLDEVLEYEAGGDDIKRSPERVADIQEVLNYRRAMGKALELLKALPLCQRVVREAHGVLLDGVRGRNRNPGTYRTTPNWIGPSGCSIEEARFVPVGAGQLPQAMDSWERFIHEKSPDRLVQLALLHAEFEAIHPFLDGNGRLGRMLVPLFLQHAGVLSQPVFYVSAYLESHRDAYYERLLAVSRDNDWTGWCVFFLQALAAQAAENLEKAQGILRLHQRMLKEAPEWTHSQYAPFAVDFIFRNPVFRSSVFTRMPAIPGPTARRILSVFTARGVVSMIRPSSGRRPATYAFRELLNIAEGRDVF